MSILDTIRRPVAENPIPTYDAALEQTRAAFEALDFSVENEDLAQIKVEIAKTTEAIEDARRRIAELGEDGRSGEDGRAVADALLAGEDPDNAARNVTAAGERAERKAALLGAIPALVDKRREATFRRDAIGHEAKRRARLACKSLTDAIVDEARQAAEVLKRCYADLTALNAITDGDSRESREQREVVAAISRSGIVTRTGAIPVSPAIRSLSEKLSGKGEAFPLKYGIASEIGVP